MTQLSKITLENFLFSNGIPSAHIYVPDALYVCPSWNWLLSDFRNELFRFVNEYLGLYDAECTDCDDFAMAAQFCGDWLHRRTPNRPHRSALSLGQFWYSRSPTSAHAIVSATVADHPDCPGEIKLVFLEPQPRAFGPINLTPEQIETCSIAKF